MRSGLAIGVFGASVLLALALMHASALLPSCGLRLGTLDLLDFCRDPAPGGASPELAAELDRRTALEDRLQGLERRLAALPACSPPPAARPRQPAPAQPAPAQPAPPPPPDRLDAERWQEQDVAMLEGCWSLASDYRVRHRTTGAIAEVDSFRMCFDTDGRGEQWIVRSDGAECTGPITASFADDGRLRIDDGANVHCDDQTYIFRRKMLPDYA